MEKTTRQALQKLGIDTPLALALIVPVRYEDYRLEDRPRFESEVLVDATITSVRLSPAALGLRLYLHNFSFSLEGVIFRPRPYQRHIFAPHKRLYLYGKLTCKNGSCTLVMPKVVDATRIGEIVPVYKTPLRSATVRKLIARFIDEATLQSADLPPLVIAALLDLHFPKHTKTVPTQEHLYALKYLELVLHLRKLSRKKHSFPALSSGISDISKWIKTLPFSLTKDQRNAINDIARDLKQPVAARRIVVGDVGSGKTVVMLATARMNFPNTTILMAPTTVLARQIYEEAAKLLPELRRTLITNKTKTESLSGIHLIVGTHALLYRELPQASVVIVDEQHRFGTKQRASLAKLVSQGEKKPHFFQFSATPIPRTQAMIQAAHIDVTLMLHTPFQKHIHTRVIHKEDFPTLLKHIENEIKNNRQILIVYPLVSKSDAIVYRSIEEARAFWENKFSGVYVTYGKDKKKETVLSDFAKNGSILLATTVIEVGISLDRLSSVVIVGAERLGLATLHQLRGRVARLGSQGYCFLYTLTKNNKRLEAFCNTTDGFEIARLDLAFRDSGDVLGGEAQSGKTFRFLDLSRDEALIAEVSKKFT